MIEHLGRSKETGLEVFALAIPTAEALPDSFDLCSPKFTCFLVWEATPLDLSLASSTLEKLLARGCVYLCCWGKNSERLHDLMDEVIVGDGTSQWVDCEIMTTWHAEEGLGDALDFFLELAEPTEHNQSKCGSAIVLLIEGSPVPVLDSLRQRL